MRKQSFANRAKGRGAGTLGMSLVLALAACGGDGSTAAPSGPPGASCSVSGTVLPTTDATVTLDPAQRFQTIQGFGSSQRLFDDPHLTNTFDQVTQRAGIILSAAEQAKILDALYVDLGLTRVRVHPEGFEPVNDNSDPLSADLSKFNFAWKAVDGHIAQTKSLVARGVTTYFASPIVIESWMSESNPAEYAEWAFVMLRRWRDQGLEMPYYSLMNEPGYPRSGYWSGAWLRDVAKLLGARLKAEGIKTKLVVPDDVSAKDAYERLPTILSDPDARQYIGAIAYHLYERRGVQEVKQIAAQYNIPIWMTEWSTTDWFEWARAMQELLADDGVSAIDYMWGYFGDWDNAQLVRVRVNGSSYAGFDFNRQYYAMGQYSRYVRPGAVRIAATSSDTDVKVVAFVDGPKVIVVATNVGSTDRSVRFELGSSATCLTKVESVRTSESESWKGLPDVTLDAPRFAATVPARSVTTFVAR
jgi:O-glycosyl hydrolase